MNDLILFLKPLLLTLLLECGFACILGLRKKELLLTALINLITNPILVYISLLLMYHIGIEKGQIITYLLLEPLVVLSEYLLYRKYLPVKRNCLSLSLILNLISVLGGLLWQKMF